jgi:hypothetical protein
VKKQVVVLLFCGCQEPELRIKLASDEKTADRCIKVKHRQLFRQQIVAETVQSNVLDLKLISTLEEMFVYLPNSEKKIASGLLWHASFPLQTDAWHRGVV